MSFSKFTRGLVSEGLKHDIYKLIDMQHEYVQATVRVKQICGKWPILVQLRVGGLVVIRNFIF